MEGSELSFRGLFLYFDLLSSDVIIGVAISLILSPHSETSHACMLLKVKGCLVWSTGIIPGVLAWVELHAKLYTEPSGLWVRLMINNLSNLL